MTVRLIEGEPKQVNFLIRALIFQYIFFGSNCEKLQDNWQNG